MPTFGLVAPHVWQHGWRQERHQVGVQLSAKEPNR